MTYVVVRLRGLADRNHAQKRTLAMLRLHYVNHATIVLENETYNGMVHKVEHFITYGELTKETAVKLLKTRGRAPGNKPLTDAYLSEKTPYASLEALADALVAGDVDLARVDGVKPVFRLAPARGGFEGKKRHFSEGGALGYRGKEINQLIERML